MNIKNLHIRTLVFSPYRGTELQKDYLQELKASIGSKGLLMPLLVTELDNGLYAIIDGYHRFTVCEQLGYESIPCNVLKLTREQENEMQIMTSVPYMKTKSEDYKRNLKRLIAINPLLILPQLKDRINKSSEWLQDMLGLNSMNPKVLNKVQDGSIKLSNALALAELPTHMQGDYADQAINLQPTDFVPMILNKVFELKISSEDSSEDEQSQGDA